MMQEETQTKTASPTRPLWQYVLFIIILVIIAFVVGVLIGWAAVKDRVSPQSNEKKSEEAPTFMEKQSEALTTNMITEEIKTENLRENLRYLTSEPHNAGTPGDERLTNWIRDRWKDQKMDVKQYWYNVLLSFPDITNPNKISLLDDTGSVRFSSQTKEAALDPGLDISKMIPPFNAYSPSGDVEADLVYANYGTVDDFMALKNNYSIDLTNKIVIMRYGKLYRGNKVQLATEHGASGVILYSDPADIAPFPEQSVYPDSWWLPPTGVQRGTILLDTGDPQTPGYPSIDSAYRLPEANLSLPKIPCHAIGYGDAIHLLSRMTGPVAPEGWKGTIPEITYRLGPGLNETGWKVRLHVSTTNRLVNTSNVIGFIRGSEEPDRYVLIGNHRDAWGFGAIDPSSGTTVLMELSRVFSEMANKGIRPRRTLVFCSWGAEEYGLIGSYEWVENYVAILAQRAVAYLNVDIAVLGNATIDVGGLPLLYDVIYDAAKKVTTPNDPAQTVYDEMLKMKPRKSPEGDVLSVPDIHLLGSGSDFDPFVTFAGVPSVDLSYFYNTKELPISFYPLYHTVYETLSAYEKFLDPEYKYSQTVARFVAEMARDLADSVLLPYNARTFGEEIQGYMDTLDTKYGALFNTKNISLNMMKAAVTEFKKATSDFESSRDSIDLDNVWAVRSFNDQLMQLERAFILPGGLPERAQARHTLFAPSSKDLYSGAAFPGLVDLLFEIDKANNPHQRWEQVRKHLAEVIYRIKVATSIVAPYTGF